MSLRSKASMFACGLAAAMIVSVSSCFTSPGGYLYVGPGRQQIPQRRCRHVEYVQLGFRRLGKLTWSDSNAAWFQGTGGVVTLNQLVNPTGITFSNTSAPTPFPPAAP